jgi:hypothetical protein
MCNVPYWVTGVCCTGNIALYVVCFTDWQTGVLLYWKYCKICSVFDSLTGVLFCWKYYNICSVSHWLTGVLLYWKYYNMCSVSDWLVFHCTGYIALCLVSLVTDWRSFVLETISTLSQMKLIYCYIRILLWLLKWKKNSVQNKNKYFKQ